MMAYRHDDGSEMVEIRPGQSVRREVALALGLLIPTMGPTGRVASLASALDPQPAVPPLQPSHADLVSIATEPAVLSGFEAFVRDQLDAVGASLGLTYDQVTADWPSLARHGRPPKPRPAKRSIADILAEADRGYRALRRKAKA